MPKLTREQIASHARAAGFTGNDINIAVAVALAESGGDTHAHNPVPPDDSYGLWQINMLGSMGPERRKRYGLAKNDDLYDPAVNARVARGIWNGSGWKAWTTYTRGTYKRFMNADSPGSDTGSVAPVSSNTDGGDGISGAIRSAANALSQSMFKGLANVYGILLAIALIVTGVIILAREPLSNAMVAKRAIGKALK
jgi:hypothetical protein